MSTWIKFCEASVLERMYGKELLQHYNYEDSYRKHWFSPITSYFTIEKVIKINNPQLYGMFLLREEEFKNSNLYTKGKLSRQILYHATSRSKAESIARSNIDWRQTFRSRFGMGACFSDCPQYAHRHASSNGAFVIFEVLTKNIETVGVSYTLKVPTKNKYDTTLSSNKMVYVKYDDYQFYPKFIVYYNKRN